MIKSIYIHVRPCTVIYVSTYLYMMIYVRTRTYMDTYENEMQKYYIYPYMRRFTSTVPARRASAKSCYIYLMFTILKHT